MRKIIFLISFLASLIGFAQDGSLDMSFNVQGTISPSSTLKIQPDGKLLLVERFHGTNGLVESTRITRLNSDGSSDLTFAGGVGLSVMPNVASVAIQSDGKILIGGNFFKVENDFVGNLVRLNQDGTLDTSFTKVIQAGIEVVAVQPDDKIIIGGNFPKGIARLYSNGFTDPFFNSPIDIAAENETVSNLVLQNDNRILAVGFVTIDGNPRRVFYLNSDGELDPGFNEPSNIDWTGGDLFTPKFLVREKNDNVLIGWPFRIFDASEQTIGYNFVRLSPDGNLVNIFNPVPLTDNCVLGVFPAGLQVDGKIVMTGYQCPDYYGIEFNGIMRFNNDGSFDDTFIPGTGPNNNITDLVIQPDGKILIAGNFTEYNGVAVPNLIRLSNSTLTSDEFGGTTINVYPNPVAEHLYIEYPSDMDDTDIDEIEIYDVTMKKIEFDGLNKDVIDVSGFSDGVYLLKIRTEDLTYTTRFVKN